jgi:hypothetical protein
MRETYSLSLFLRGADHETPFYPRKLALHIIDNWRSSVGIFRSRTKGDKFFFLMRVSRELSRYRLYLVGVQEIRWEGSDAPLAAEYKFFYGKRNKNPKLGIGVFCS